MRCHAILKLSELILLLLSAHGFTAAPHYLSKHMPKQPCSLLRQPKSITAAMASNEQEEAYGVGMDQDAMMESDMLIVVDAHDVVVPDTIVSKKQAHAFSSENPRGVAHRAFSFFLFNSERKLLLTRRADSKITFPGVWTNTACSHPLLQMNPSEVDDASIAYPDFPGIKHAAIRKLKHELGIDNQLRGEDMVFISRFHYWAADTNTYGSQPPWGEHEIDYVLFCQSDAPISISANPDEVSEYKYVSIQELRDMMQDPSLKWSPWFLGIMEKGGWKWWEDMDNSLAGKNTERTIHFFNPPDEYYASYNKDPSHTKHTGVVSISPASSS